MPKNTEKNTPKNTFVKSSRAARAAAYIVDTFCLEIFNLTVWSLIKDFPWILSFTFPFIYFWATTALYGKTIGKKLFGLEVVTSDNSKMTWSKAFLREVLGKIVSGTALALGYVWILFDEKRQGWHDKIAGTYVMQVEPLEGGKKILAYILTIFGLITLVYIVLFIVSINNAG